MRDCFGITSILCLALLLTGCVADLYSSTTEEDGTVVQDSATDGSGTDSGGDGSHVDTAGDGLGDASVEADGADTGLAETAPDAPSEAIDESAKDVVPDLVAPDGFEASTEADTGGTTCSSYDSTEQEYAPVQTVGSPLPAACASIVWSRPAVYTYLAPFDGTPGQPANHEGVDYVDDDTSVSTVMDFAAADGTVAYVRIGCPQSTVFGHNNSLRECGAGWGNHVVVDHGNHVFTRYGHIRPGTVAVQVGDAVVRGQVLGEMGNSGRSETRHLHFELGTMTASFDPCEPAQSFDLVYDSEKLNYK